MGVEAVGGAMTSSSNMTPPPPPRRLNLDDLCGQPARALILTAKGEHVSFRAARERGEAEG